MKHILIFILLCLASELWAQYPNGANKLVLGRQTTGDGLIFRGDSIPSFTPTSNANAWFFLDTAAQVLYTHIGGTWVSLADTITSGGTVTLSGEVVGESNATKLDTVDRVIFDPTNGGADSTYKLTYNANDFTLHFGMGLGNQVYQMGQELYYPPCINKTASTIYAGQPVMIDTSGIIQGDRLAVMPAFANGLPADYIVGVAAHDIAPDAEGLVTWFGYVREVDEADIAASGVTLDVGDILYLSATPGKYSDTEPAAPAINSTIALVVRKPNANNMTLLVRPWLNEKLGDLTDVDLSGIADGDALVWDSISGTWQTAPKQDPLTGTGLVKSTGGTISYVTDNSADWNAAYNDRITGAAFTGSTTKTLTLTQQDAGTITASFTDLQGVTSVATGVGLSGGTITTTGTISADTTVLVSKDFLTNQGYTSNVGTVTSVATGVGLTGGTITSSGTISADTTVLVSKTFLTNQGYTNNVGTVTSIATSNGIAGGTITGSGTISLTGQASSLHNLMTNGIITRGDEGFIDAVTITAGTGISIANGDGVSGNPTITNSAPEATTARNVNATGEGIYRDEVGNELQFKKLVAGSNVTLTSADSTITIASTASGTGTVTSITAGVGLNGGTITTSGTIDADTSVLSTVYALADTASVLRGLIPAGTNFGTVAANKVAFGAASGDTLTSDTDLHWDATNNRLGIGETNPSFDITLPTLGGSIGLNNGTINGGNLSLRSAGSGIGTNLNGGTLNLIGGQSTGTGSSIIRFFTSGGTLSSSNINTSTLRMTLTGLGNLGINTQSPSRLLHVEGEVRITDLTTDTPTRIVGADADGDLGEITTGNGLTITSGALSVDTATIATVSAVRDTASTLRGLIAAAATDFGTVAANKVAFGAASGDTLTSDTDFHWDSTNKRLGIRTSTPASAISIDAASANDNLRVYVPTSITSGGFNALNLIRDGDGAAPRNINISFAHFSNFDFSRGVFVFARGRGSSTSPSGVLNNDYIGSLTFQSYDSNGAAVASTAQINAIADADATSGTTPTRLSFVTGTTAANRPERMVIKSDGNVGIATTAPSSILSIGGNSPRTIGTERHTTANNAGNNLTIKVGGAASGATDAAGGDLILESGVSTGTGSSNIIFETAAAGSSGTTDRTPEERMRITGSAVGILNTSPDSALTVTGGANFSGTVLGSRLKINTSGQALEINNFYPSGTNGLNFFIGNGGANMSGSGDLPSRNFGIGNNALLDITSGNNNIAFGDDAGQNITSGVNNILIGSNSGENLTDGQGNTAIGVNALDYSNVSYNTAIGSGALSFLNSTSNGRNTAVGYQAMATVFSGADNVAVGHDAGRLSNAGSNLATNANSIFIGSDARSFTTSAQNEIVIGYQGRGNGSNTVTIGNSSTTNNYFNGVIRTTSAIMQTAGVLTVTTASANLNTSPNNTYAYVIVNYAGTCTLTLPTASNWTGREIKIKTITANIVKSASSNVLPIDDTTASDAILPATDGKWATLVSDGTNWVIMQAN